MNLRNNRKDSDKESGKLLDREVRAIKENLHLKRSKAKKLSTNSVKYGEPKTKKVKLIDL